MLKRSGSEDSSAIPHWHKHVDEFQMSPGDFYAELEAALTRRELPAVKLSRVTHVEEGLFSRGREYLRVERKRLAFDICAAPFGKGFFFSWWLDRAPHAFKFGWVIPLALFCFAVWMVGEYGFKGLFLATIFTVIGLLAAGKAVHDGMFFSEDSVLAIPLLGGWYERIFHPSTYYAEDTEILFQEIVPAVVLEAVDRVLTQNGLRALAEPERVPTVRQIRVGAKR